jgi:hypothetical protein
MIVGMPSVKLSRLRLSFALAMLASCAGVSPRPETASIAELQWREPTPGESERARSLAADAVAAIVQRRYAEADAAAAAALALEPRSPRAIAIRAMVQVQLAAAADPPPLLVVNTAERDLRLAAELAPHDPFVGWLGALFLFEQGHVSAAAAAAEDALARCQQAPPIERAALLGIAGTYRYELGEERRALPHLQAYCLTQPEDATAQFRLGSCLLRLASERAVAPTPVSRAAQLRQAEEAARAFARCGKLAPGDEDVALAEVAALGLAAELAVLEGTGAREGWLTMADERVAAGAQRFPASAEWPFRRGVLAEQRGGDRAADATTAAAYEEALERSPEHVGSLLNLAHLRLRSGDAQDARQLLGRLLAIEPVPATLDEREIARIQRWLQDERNGAAAAPLRSAEDQKPRML